MAVLLALFIFGVLVACSGSEESAENAQQAVVDALQRGDRVSALSALDDLRESGPDTPDGLLEFTGLLVAAGESPQARWLLEDGVERFPKRDDLRMALGQVALMGGDASAARRIVSAISPESDLHVSALVLRAQAELQLGDLDRALQILVEAEDRYPESAEARLARVGMLVAEQRLEEAMVLLDEARQMDSKTEHEQSMLRRLEITAHSVALRRGKFDEAIAGLNRLVEEEPEDMAAWQALGQALGQAGRLDEAIERVRGALAAHPENLSFYPLVSSFHLAAGEDEKAEQILLEFRDRSDSPSSSLQLAHFYLLRQNEVSSLAVFVEALERFPGDAMLRNAYTEALVTFDRIDAARIELERFRRSRPRDSQVEYLRARIELASGDVAAAVARLEKLVTELDDAPTQFWLGRALEKAGDLIGADRRYRLALARNRQELAFYTHLLRLVEQRGDWRSAATIAELQARNLPGIVEGWISWVAALVNLEEGGAAEELARLAAAKFVDRSEFPLLRASALRVQGRYADALAQLDGIEKTFGVTPEIAVERALTLGLAGRGGEALVVATEGLAASPDSAALHLARARLLFAAGAAEPGAADTDRALQLEPDDPTPLRVRAEFRAATGDFEGARADCQRYLEIRPDDSSTYYILGAVMARLGKDEEAIAAYRRAGELDESAFAPRNNLAGLLADRGDIDGAIAAAQQAYALADTNPFVMDTLGELYLRKGLVERAIGLLERARKAAPGLAEAQLHLALAYREADRVAEARDLLAELRARKETVGEFRRRVEDAEETLE